MALIKSPTILLVLVIFTIYILYKRTTLYLRRLAFKNHHNCQPCRRTYHKDPLFALDSMRESLVAVKQRRLLAANAERFRKMGANTYHARAMTAPFIVTCEPENVKTVLSLRFKDYSLGNRVHCFSDLLGDGIFNSDGERWALSRHLLRPSFARDQVADLEGLERHVGLLLARIPAEGRTVDLQRLFFRFTLDSATGFLFGLSTDSLASVGEGEADQESVFAEAFRVATADIVEQHRWGPFKRFRPGRAEVEEACRRCHEYVERFVDEAILWRRERDERTAQGKTDRGAAEDDGRYVFLRELAKQTTDRTRLRTELINILLAGKDSTACLLGNLFFELAKRPELWAKLREEVAVLEGRPPTYEELRNLKLVKYSLNEALRLYPVVPSNTRLAIRDTVLPLGGGADSKSPLFVPAGTTVGYNTFVMHRRTDYFGPDALSFRPERWETLRPGWEYLPFNGGPRICLGQQYALTEAGYVTVRLVQEFKRLESRDVNGGVWVEGYGLMLCSGNGTAVGLFKE